MHWYIEAMKKYAVLTGRARRQEYWMFILINIAISIAGTFVLSLLGGTVGLGTKLANLFSAVYSLAVILPSVGAAIRRLHDTGRSGWWMLVPVANFVFLCLPGQMGTNRFGSDPKVAVA